VSRVRDLHPPLKRRDRRATATRVRPTRLRSEPSVSAPRQARSHRYPTTPAVPARRDDEIRDRGPVQDRGLGLLMIFTAGVLVMVALITLTTILGGWWMLPLVMAADLAVTAGVLAIIVRLLKD
jgi:hypothetical protein